MLGQLCLTPWTVAHQAPLTVGFSRQESWSGLSSSPGDLLHPGIEWASPALADSLFYHCTHLGSLRIDFTSLCTVSHDDPIDFHSIACFWSYCSWALPSHFFFITKEETTVGWPMKTITHHFLVINMEVLWIFHYCNQCNDSILLHQSRSIFLIISFRLLLLLLLLSCFSHVRLCATP